MIFSKPYCTNFDGYFLSLYFFCVAFEACLFSQDWNRYCVKNSNENLEKTFIVHVAMETRAA